jgi:hypothetical protein
MASKLAPLSLAKLAVNLPAELAKDFKKMLKLNTYH